MIEDGTRELDFTDAVACFDAICEGLRQGVVSSKHPWHLMTLASVGRDGSPEARTLVVRGFDAAARRLRFHTAWRGPKVAERAPDARVTLVLYDTAMRWQLRIPARATLHHGDEVAAEAWRQCLPFSRSIYAVPDAPSAEIGDRDWPAAPPIPDEHDAAVYANFCVVDCAFDRLEVVVLRAAGHRRARLEWHGDSLRLVRLAP